MFSEDTSVKEKLDLVSGLMDIENDPNEQAYLADVFSVLERMKYHQNDLGKEAQAKKKLFKKKKQEGVAEADKSGVKSEKTGTPNVAAADTDDESEAEVSASTKAEIENLKFTPAFLQSISMILVSEIGDKTFFIAAIMAMRHSRMLVFTAAIGALAVMTVLSAALGYALPALLSRNVTHMVSTGLFFVFGLRLLYDASQMDPKEPNDELAEVELTLAKKDEDIEGGKAETPVSPEKKKLLSALEMCISPVFLQTFTLTFLAEWGDRSQIATIALASAKNPYGVTIGGILGHACCTGLAVLGGKLLATRISERMVALVGGILFLLFSMLSIMGLDGV